MKGREHRPRPVPEMILDGHAGAECPALGGEEEHRHVGPTAHFLDRGAQGLDSVQREDV